jgi:uncharacterized membrane protein YsdA (DUF1294 family)
MKNAGCPSSRPGFEAERPPRRVDARLALALVAALAALNLLGFALALLDKRRARRGGRRVREATFHLLALLGAWPGTLAGFLLARHKTAKPRFLAPFALAALAGTALAVFLALRLG